MIELSIKTKWLIDFMTAFPEVTERTDYREHYAWKGFLAAKRQDAERIDSLTRRIDELNSNAIDVSDAELTRSYREGIDEGKRQDAERIAELEAELEWLNKLCWNTNSECRQHHQASNDKSAEIAELRAKLDALEKQEPVCYFRYFDGKPDWAEDCVSPDDTCADGYEIDDPYTAVPLYAKPAPATNEGEL